MAQSGMSLGLARPSNQGSSRLLVFVVVAIAAINLPPLSCRCLWSPARNVIRLMTAMAIEVASGRTNAVSKKMGKR